MRVSPTHRALPLQRAALLCLAVIPVVGAALGSTPAIAATPISGVKKAAITSSSFTITLNSLGPGWKYRLYASTTKADLYYDHLTKAPHRSALAATPRVSVTGLAYTSAPYWYRLQATKGTSHRTGDLLALGLRPATPSALQALRGAQSATYLTWSGAASGFNVQQATDARFTQNVSSYVAQGPGHLLSPYALPRGRTYFWRVRAVNHGTPSAYTAAVSAVPQTPQQRVRVMTLNVLSLDNDGAAVSGGGSITSWSQRRVAAASYIHQADPDIIGIQEGAPWVHAVKGPRQVDDLVSALGGAYALATTEVPPSQPGYFRTGDYVLYKKATYSAVGEGGHWNIGDMPQGGSRWAAYQVLRNKATGATVLFVSPHLFVNSGSQGDSLRRSEARSLFAQGSAYAANHGGLPVVYAGDFNSHVRHALDGPAVEARAAHLADAELVARYFTNHQYNSANGYQRTPPAAALSVDHVYVSPGVGVASWRLSLNLSHGTFVGVIPSDHNALWSDLWYYF